jgi:SAM-dependent methyltransferase
MRTLDLLTELGLSDANSAVLYRQGVRDRTDIKVFRCERSGVIFLESDDHVTAEHYEDWDDLSYWGGKTRDEVVRSQLEDDRRRAEFIRPHIANKRWLDIGTGVGGILTLAAGSCAEAAAVEPQRMARQELIKLGFTVHAAIADAPKRYFDAITLFHVFEHIPKPVAFLRAVGELLAPGGRIYIEVPHARDFLVDFVECAPFISFTLWSEHLILHTRKSLVRFVAASGFSRCSVSGIQRYPLANHLYWLAKGKPGGQHIWPMLSNNGLNEQYTKMLDSLDHTDTLMACVEA